MNSVKPREKIPSKEDTIKAILKTGISEKVLNAEFVKIKKEINGYVENEDVLMLLSRYTLG
jgi:hypothetical protein